jgi:hypothetical protein
VLPSAASPGAAYMAGWELQKEGMRGKLLCGGVGFKIHRIGLQIPISLAVIRQDSKKIKNDGISIRLQNFPIFTPLPIIPF